MAGDETAVLAPATPPGLAQVSLDDKFDLGKRRIFISGSQAIVRLLLSQSARDRAAGLNTAGFISGYRGSPLGGLDLQFQRAGARLGAANIIFQPGLNEDLAATAVWGSQQAQMRGEGKYDGVFSIWYGKGPGVDRSGDVFRHANLAGTAPRGGVLVLMGDDHIAESSTTAHQSEFQLLDVMMPVLNPAGVQELLDYGLYGWALSRYASVWVGLKCVKDNIESTASIDGSIDRMQFVTPDFELPPGGLSIRPNDPVLTQEARLQDHKRDAIVAFLRANPINRIITSGGPNAKIGVITTGKSYLDVRQALDELGIDEVRANALGLRLYKLGCAWPIEPHGLKQFARGLDMIIVVEEKRSLLEVQVREELYGTANPPVVVGKRDERGEWLFPVKGALDTNEIAIAIGERLLRADPGLHDIAQSVSRLRQSQARLAQTQEVAQRIPYFCSGCPHNSSTKVPSGSRAYAGIGCHYMVQWMDRATEGFTQMGGEGANWIGEAPFSTRTHVFQNLGDGTYNHSGALAIRFALASKANITYKILFNDAVAMTGGQSHDGDLTVDRIARQVAADGVATVALVTDEPDKYPAATQWPQGMSLHHRDELDSVQRRLAGVSGVSVLIYDQTCAAEKRRRRKRGAYADPDKRVIINPRVCEGCGDCGVKSNCVSVQPLETVLGRKRTIDQSSCNKDFSCVNGFCPSFVTVHGAQPKKLERGLDMGATEAFEALPQPVRRDIGDAPYGILVTGIGGTGVITIGAILGMAAHLEGKGCGMMDMAGLAQKGGAVFCHVKLARSPDDIHAIRIAAGEADLVLGCDLVVSGTRNVLAAVRRDETGFVVNTAEVYPGDFARNPDFRLPGERIKNKIRDAAGDGARFVDANAIATALLGASIAANMFMLGYAWQAGLVPLSREAIFRALELNGEAVEMNRRAFQWGRRALVEPQAVQALIDAAKPPGDSAPTPRTPAEIVDHRVNFLTQYQNAAYAAAYRTRVERVAAAERAKTPGMDGLAGAVARYLFKLMAIKDEYEVARLYTDGEFLRQVQSTFEGNLRFEFHLAPPIFARKDAAGAPRKTTFGPWMMQAFRWLASFKSSRGGVFDIFGYNADRRADRQRLADYEILLEEMIGALSPANHAVAVALASLPENIRGYGHVREASAKTVEAERSALLERFRNAADLKIAAE